MRTMLAYDKAWRTDQPLLDHKLILNVLSPLWDFDPQAEPLSRPEYPANGY